MSSIMLRLSLFLCGVIYAFTLNASGFSWEQNKNQIVVCDENEKDVVKIAIKMYSHDYKSVFLGRVDIDNSVGDIYVGTLSLSSKAEQMLSLSEIKLLADKDEAFIIVERNKKLIVVGSDERGTAYGILELSRMIGVSPWEWWADSTPIIKKEVSLKNNFVLMQSPSVAYRGIFLNDEDWGLMPWSSRNYEKSDVNGRIGPKTHERIFELLLRLRANTFWPAMHDCSEAFFLTPGNKEIAEKYSIVIGTSHCEPMLRNTNAEWKVSGKGEYDYVNNRNEVVRFWEDRVSSVSNLNGIYTLGIRGVHDGKMQGANTILEQRDAIDKIFVDQRNIIKRYVNSDVKKVPQVFIPYKEVLDVYNSGLEVPEDVTLMWTDDNYGYIRHFPTREESLRKGGNGVYYHISYWGRPHDYLWLSTIHPALIFTQMKTAYSKGAREMWIVNVGDIKPGEYNIELFLDMAWDIDAIADNEFGLNEHMKLWLEREFGSELSDRLLKLKNEYYRLAYIRKPEHMGNTRTEERDKYYSQLKDLPWSEKEIVERLNDYNNLENELLNLSSTVDMKKIDTWFQLIEYPIRGSVEMNRKHLYAQLARHSKVSWEKSDMAHQAIIDLSKRYNSLSDGKWNLMMDYKPRNLAVFGPVPHEVAEKSMKEHIVPLHLFNGKEYSKYIGDMPIGHGLGYQRKAVSISKRTSLIYEFDAECNDSISIEVALVPNLPIEGNYIRYGISFNDGPMEEVDFKTVGRSEEWKENVLTNRAKRVTLYKIDKKGTQRIEIKALDDGVVLDQIKVVKI